MSLGACILVFGVSGVGKTSACDDYAARHPQWLHLRASELLSTATASASEDLRKAAPARIRANQDLLSEQLALRRLDQEARPVLIDAHAIIDNDRQLVRVPVEAVRSLEPRGFILLEAAPAVIAQRRAEGRPRPQRTHSEIAREMEAERRAVQFNARELNVPTAVGSTADGLVLDPLIDSLLSIGGT